MGMKDIWTHLHTNPPQFLYIWERDIDNAYWKINKQKVSDAVRKAADTVKMHRPIHNTFCFCVAKRGRTGPRRTPSGQKFRCVHNPRCARFRRLGCARQHVVCSMGGGQDKKGVPKCTAYVHLGPGPGDEFPGGSEEGNAGSNVQRRARPCVLYWCLFITYFVCLCIALVTG